MRKIFLLSLLFCFSLGAQQPPTVSIPIGTNWQFGPNTGITSSGLYAGYGGSFSQALSTAPAQMQEYKPGYTVEGVYVLKFSTINNFPSYPGYYTAEVSFGTQELCETSGWGTKPLTEITLVCPSPGYLIVDKALPLGGPAQGQQNFKLTVTVQGWTLLFPTDKVTLDFQAAGQ